MQERDTDQDHYPDLTAVFQKVLAEDDFPEGAIERIEVTGLASGEATWRVWPARSEEHVGGYYPTS